MKYKTKSTLQYLGLTYKDSCIYTQANHPTQFHNTR